MTIFQAPLALAGHLVSIAMVFTTADKTYGAGRVVKLAMKKTKTIKSEYVVLDTIAHTKFIKELFCVHDLADQYSPGIHMGPRFKFSWMGSPYVVLFLLSPLLTFFLNSGGKSGASTIETDHEWDVARAAVMKKNKDTCGVSVEIDIDAMDGFRIRKRVFIISFTCVVTNFMIVSDPCTC